MTRMKLRNRSRDEQKAAWVNMQKKKEPCTSHRRRNISKTQVKTIQGMKVVCKSTSVMGDYIALHGLMSKKDMPAKFRGKIPSNEIWIREDRYHDKNLIRKKMLITHEASEIALMKKHDFNYKEAHAIAEVADQDY